jgi:hypothetical protein
MRKLYFAVAFVLFISSACTKTISSKPTRDPYNDPPVIKIQTPSNLEAQVFRPYDQLTVKATITDIDLVAIASWEALNAAPVCGTNPYRGSFNPMTYEYELSFSFTIPPFFPGDHILRLYAVDASGNIATVDIPYKSTN